jgi:hypothetical protein
LDLNYSASAEGDPMRLVRLALIFLLFSWTPAWGADFYVSSKGNDRNAGTLAKPFATLERARAAARAAKGNGPVTVWLLAGTYILEHTFRLTAEDSGTIYQAYRNAPVRLLGGRPIRGFRRVTDSAVLQKLDPAARGKVVALDLKAQGITNFGELTARGFSRPTHVAGLELFFQDKPMQLARWPNRDWAKTADVTKGKEDRFQYEGDRPARWAGLNDVWVHGYWTWDWADSYEKVKSIGTASHEIVTYPPHGVYGYAKGKRYYALNILEELDEPGEWYLDRASGVLYFWPPAPLKQGEAAVSLLEDPLLALEGASNVTLRGFTLEYARGDAVEVRGGAGNQIVRCVIRNIGNVGINIASGERQSVSRCDISQTGDSAVILAGGDRPTLTPAGNSVEDCDIHEFGRWVRTYTPGVLISGVGNRIEHNRIHDSPHCAILLSGNEHHIEFNEIHHVALETHDVGAFYLGRNYTERGTVVRYNYFHHLGTGSVKPEDLVQAVYLDDCASGTLVYGNVFYRAGRSVLIGGGRDNTIENNIFVEGTPAVHVDARGLGWASFWFNGKDNTLIEGLKAMHYKEPPYSTRYPQLLSLYEEPDTAVPKGNDIVRNVSYGGKWLDLLDGMTDKIIHLQDNFIDGDPGFVDAARANFQLRDDSPVFKLGFKRIPIEQIGPRL